MKRILYSAQVQQAVHWLKTNCRHWAIAPDNDWQTMENLTPEDKVVALQHLDVLKERGLVIFGGYKGRNFWIKNLPGHYPEAVVAALAETPPEMLPLE